jgi:GntR family transcriptional regulator
VFLERIRCADGAPLAIDRTWLPMSIGAPLLHSNFEHTALYDEMERLCGVRPNAGWERIAPLVPSPTERETLQLKRGQAAFFIERLSTAGDQRIEWRTTTVRGDRYRFVSQFEAGSAPALVATARD